MMYEHRQYLIFKTEELNKVDFTQILETSQQTVRKSVDGSKTFIKWEHTPPSFITQLSDTEGPYTYSQIKDILSTEEWASQNVEL